MIIVVTWFGGFFFSALWTSSLEREEHKSARLYARLMAFCYFLCFLAVAASEFF
jgi:hypothetical protein